MIKQILFILLFIQGIAWAELFNYDGVSIGMKLNKVKLAGYTQCEPDPAMGATWVSCTSTKNFFPAFQTYNVDDVEIELPDGKTVVAINLITSNNITATELADKVNGKITNKNSLSLITIKNHDDSLVVIKGKIAIMSSNAKY